MGHQRYVERRGANHGLHVFLTIITCGLWAITGWPIAAAMGRKTVTTVPVYQPPQVMPPQQYAPPQQPTARPYYPQMGRNTPYSPPPGQQPGPYGQQPPPQPPPRPNGTSWGQQ